jgi:hypothetical protein
MRRSLLACLWIIAVVGALQTDINPHENHKSYFAALKPPVSEARSKKALQVVRLNPTDSYSVNATADSSRPTPVLLVATLDGRFHSIDYHTGKVVVRVATLSFACRFRALVRALHAQVVTVCRVPAQWTASYGQPFVYANSAPTPAPKRGGAPSPAVVAVGPVVVAGVFGVAFCLRAAATAFTLFLAGARVCIRRS